jgi:hypothetical protein
MKANELRHCNIVFNTEANEATEIYLYGIHRILECERDKQNHVWQPIQLTEEWLRKLTFFGVDDDNDKFVHNESQHSGNTMAES